ncbi:hypothetical protein ATCC90586_000390 [Pythium insidiosum]|nr:hypothetical protein ATCC90586_000390 [Pythium insidiosum]
MDPFASIPEPVFRLVLGFVWSCDVERLLPHPLYALPIREFEQLAGVNRRWRETIVRLARELTERQLTVTITADATADERPWMDVLRAHGHAVVDLRLEMTEAVDEALAVPGAVNWTDVFQLVPRLQRLDLSRIPLCGPSIRVIVTRASEQCRAVRALILPQLYGELTDEFDDEIGKTLTRVYDALWEWYTHGSIGGLRQVFLPHRLVGATAREANAEFLDVLTRFCPKLQYADGWRATYMDIAKWVTCEDSWASSPSVWASFWAVCAAEMRAFNWVTMPFAEAFVEPFAAVVKPQMTELAIAFPVNARLQPRELCPASVFCRALGGMPKLRELSIRVQVYSGEEMLSFIDANRLLNDDVLITLAASCPHLEVLSMFEYEYAMAAQALTLVSDNGITAIGSLRHLKKIQVTNALVAVTERALVALACGSNPPRHAQRVVDLTLQPESASTLLVRFLELLATTRVGYQRLFMRLDFNARCSIPVAMAQSLKAAFESAHTSLRFALSLSFDSSAVDTLVVSSLLVFTTPTAELEDVRVPSVRDEDWICQ